LKHGTSIPRSIRLAQLQHFLHKNPKGLTSQELARLCGVCVRTIQRDLLDLQSDLNVPITQNGNRYGILGGYTLPPIFLSLYEAMALFLTARLALRQTDENNPHMQQALAKISAVLPLPLAERLKSGIQTIAGKKTNPDFIKTFESVAIAWITQRQMKIRYLSLGSDQTKEWLLEPYFVEMTGVGYSTYVIGHAIRKGKEGIITFKLDRFATAEVLDTNFEIPEDFDISRLLLHSWGIIWGDEAEIKLKFSAKVSRRVKESVWHPSQKIEELKDGGCIMTMRVGSLLEVTPWIRSWGPDVEVIEPAELRRELVQQAAELAAIYSSKVKGLKTDNE
jgi:predicted DNA-binding transcriptional regulator YafY